jgi:hypothetical protein
MELQRTSILASAYARKHRKQPTDQERPADQELPEELIPTDEEVEAYHQANPDVLAQFVAGNPRFQAAEAQEQLKRQLAEINIYAQRAKKEGLDKDPLTSLQLRIFPEGVLQGEMMRVLFEQVQINQDDLSAYYNQHKDEFIQAKARHILISTQPQPGADPTAAPPDKEKLRQKALDVLKRVRAGEDFAALAKQFSDDPGSKEQGGDLGYFDRGRMVAEFDKTVFSLEPGQVGDLVETRFGFHIIKLEDKRQAPFEDSTKDQIEQKVRQAKNKELADKIMKRFSVTIDLGPTAEKPSGEQK